MSESSLNKHNMPIRPLYPSRLNYGSGPCKVIMRGGKLLTVPEIIEVDYTDPMSLWEVQKNKRAEKK